MINSNVNATSNNFIGGIKAQAASAGSDAKVTYKYDVGADGKLVVSGAKIASTFDKPSQTSQPSFSAATVPTPTLQTQQKSNPLSTNTLGLSPSELAEIFGLDSNENQVINELQAADAGVRAHEAQHFRAAGGLVQGTAEFDYVEGPDGNLYAVGGQVEINPTNGVTDPAKQASDAATLYNAATAPADASAQDLAVARSAINQANEAYGKALKVSAGIE